MAPKSDRAGKDARGTNKAGRMPAIRAGYDQNPQLLDKFPINLPAASSWVSNLCRAGTAESLPAAAGRSTTISALQLFAASFEVLNPTLRDKKN